MNNKGLQQDYTMNKLFRDFKDCVQIPQSVTSFDTPLKNCLNGAIIYVDSILDNKSKAPTEDPLFILTVLFLAQFYFSNRDNPNVKQLPITLDSLLNRLKDKYLN